MTFYTLVGGSVPCGARIQESHGLEAHDLAEEDGERWLTHRSSYLTRFGASCAPPWTRWGLRGAGAWSSLSACLPEVARDWAVDSFTWAREMEMPFRVLPLRTLQEYSPGLATGQTSG